MQIFRAVALHVVAAALWAAAEAPQWSVQEIVLETSREYGDLYRECGVTAEVTGPDGARVTVPGFWDGRRTFRIRWTPVAKGRWKYTTRSADPGLNGRSGELQATAPVDGSHGFLRRDTEHPYSFIYDDNTRYFLFGNTYYGLLGNALAGRGWRNAVDKTNATGMNKIRFTISPDDLDWKHPDASHMNFAAWRKLDEVVRYLGARGVVADLILLQRSQVDRMELPAAERFLRYAIARYAAFPNVIWCLQNEWQYTKKPKGFWNALGAAAAGADPWAQTGGRRRGLSVHQQTRPDWEMFGDSWYSHVILQLGVRNRGKAARGGDEWNLPKERRSVFPNGDDWGNYGILANYGRGVPVVNDEYGYIGEPADETEPRGPDGKPVRYSREKHRRTMWGIYVAGGYGSAGDKNQYEDGKPYFTADWHDTPEWEDVRRLIAFFTGRGVKYWRMAAQNGVVRSGTRVYVLSDPGREYVIYAAAGGRFSLSLSQGTYRTIRFDPRTGETVDLPVTKGTTEFSMPDNRDWVVHLTAVR